MTPKRRGWALVQPCILVALLSISCRDMLPTAPKAASPTAATTTARFSCAADLHRNRTKCERVRATAHASGASYDIVLTKNDVPFDLHITNRRYTRLDSTYAADVAVSVHDPDGRTFGTRDGTSITGIKVFFDKGPAAFHSRAAPGDTTWPVIHHFSPATDTAAVRVRNPDGRGTFTAPNQPYFEYGEILDWLSNETQPRRWKFRVAPGVQYIFFEVGISAAYLGEPTPVPGVAPDTVPESLYDEQNIATDLPGMTGTYLRDVFTVLFTPEATGAERQSAIDQVGGTVVGGDRAFDTDGYYFVRIPGDGTANPMLSAISSLNALPQVLGAAPEFIESAEDALAYARPNDGTGWNETDWSINPNSASSLRWGLEAIGAPMAWGCETGDPNTKIAVVDLGFHLTPAASDVQLNTHSENFFAPGPLYENFSLVTHGVNVASVLAARGNNGAGMTGVMWNANLRLYEAGTGKSGTFTFRPNGRVRLHERERMSSAVFSRAQVINMSISVRPTAMAARISAGTATRADSVSVVQHANNLKRPIKWARLVFHRPLIVLSAGNSGNIGVNDAYWSGYPLLAAEFPDQVIAVGAAMQAASPTGGYLGGPFRRAPFSQGGPLVSIAAPGVGVGGMDNNGGVVGLQGTSFAAPLVSGAAGLLFSFDPRLTTAEVIDLLVEGARRGNRYIEDPFVTSVPVLNVYESLKLAAQRPGAPLCSNRVWTEGGAVKALRVVNGAQQIETLFSTGPDTEYLQVLHGGKQLYLYDSAYPDNNRYRFMRWNPAPGVWNAENIHPDSLDIRRNVYGPSWNSLVSVSHDRDSVAQVRNSGRQAEVLIADTLGTAAQHIATVPLPGSDSRGPYVCVLSQYEEGTFVEDGVRTIRPIRTFCRDSIQPGTVVASRAEPAAWVPGGNRVIVAVNEESATWSITGGPYECGNQWYPVGGHLGNAEDLHVVLTCRDHHQQSSKSRGNIISIPISGGAASTLYSEAAVNFVNVAAGEGTAEFVVQRQTRSGGTSTRYELQGHNILTITVNSNTAPTCVTQFRGVGGALVLYERPGCGYGEFTFSPLRAAATHSARAAPSHLQRPSGTRRRDAADRPRE